MITVYVIQSIEHPEKFYVGQAEDPVARLADHNKGRSKYTQTYRPWKVMFTEQSENRVEARKREKYFKSTAGKNDLRRRGII